MEEELSFVFLNRIKAEVTQSSSVMSCGKIRWRTCNVFLRNKLIMPFKMQCILVTKYIKIVFINVFFL